MAYIYRYDPSRVRVLHHIVPIPQTFVRTMKVDITLQDSGNGEWFAPGDEVRGVIYISMREADAISGASVSLSGNSHAPGAHVSETGALTK